MGRDKRLAIRGSFGPPPKPKKKSPDPPDKQKCDDTFLRTLSPTVHCPRLLSTRKLPPPSIPRQTRAKAAAEKQDQPKPALPSNGYIPSDQALNDYELVNADGTDSIPVSTAEDSLADPHRQHISPNGNVRSSGDTPTGFSNGRRLPRMGTSFGDGDERDKITAQFQQGVRRIPKPAAVVHDPDDNTDDEDTAGDLEKIAREAAAGPVHDDLDGLEDGETRRTWRSEGKKAVKDGQMPQPQQYGPQPADAPAQPPSDDDFDMMDKDEAASMPAEDDEVDEGLSQLNFDEVGDDENELSDDGGEPQEVVQISSSESEDGSDDEGNVTRKKKKPKKNKKKHEFDLLERPWKAEGFDEKMRKDWEEMYAKVTMHPISGSWEYTEAYQLNRDGEMLRYMEDFPLNKWVIPKALAEQAYYRLLERSRWRNLDIKIYNTQGMQEMIPGATPFASHRGPMQPMYQAPQQQGHRAIDPRNYYNPNMPYPQQPMMNGRPGSNPQQQMAYRPPSQSGPMGPPPQPGQVLPSQPNARPMQPSPQHGLPGQYQQQPRPHGHYPPQQMMHAPPQFGHPQHIGGSHGMPQHMQYGIGPNGQPGHYVAHTANAPMRHSQPGMHGHARINTDVPYVPPKAPGRKKKETPPPDPPAPPPPTPPYAKLDRPQPRNPTNKSGRKNMRKQAEAEWFPWHRDMNFKKEKADATWDTSGYDDAIIRAMAEVRKENIPIIAKLDEDVAEKQRQARNKKKGQNARRRRGPKRADEEEGTPVEIPADADDGENGEGPSKRASTTPPAAARKRGENIGGDPYYSGNFSFATEADRQKAVALGLKTPDEIMDGAEQGKIDWDLCKEIMICWNPGKKGTTQELAQAVFRIYDTLITRKQMETKTILTKRAGECIIDFCPDMLWRQTLLRICSESGMGNKDVRDRFCFNGCYADKATVTKRIAAALGQKQTNNPSKKAAQAKKVAEWKEKEDKGEAGGRRRGPLPKIESERYWEGEQEWHDQNKLDFHNYAAFFGRRTSKRIGLGGSSKRRLADMQDGDVIEGEGGDKRAKIDEGASPGAMTNTSELSEVQSVGGAEEEDDEHEDDFEVGDEDDDEDAVSEQSDGVLDEIED